MSSETALYGFKFREPDQRRETKDGRRRYDIKQLWQRSHEILNLALLGHKQTDIAKLVGVSPQAVCDTLNSTLGKEELAARRRDRNEEYEELQDEVMELTRRGLKIYEEILNAEGDPNVSLKMQKETADTVVLELSGLRAPTRIDSRHVNMVLSPEEIEAFKKRGLEAARAAGKLIEVEDEGKRS